MRLSSNRDHVATMSLKPFALVVPCTTGLSAALTRGLLTKSGLPVYATYRKGNPEEVKNELLRSLDGVDPSRLIMLHLDLRGESSIRSAAERLGEMLPCNSYLQTGFFAGGALLNPEKQPEDIDLAIVRETFDANVISQLLLMKHFSRFLPSASMSRALSDRPLAKWVHITTRVGSIGDNSKGGWYSYRASKAASDQAMHTFDLHLKRENRHAMAAGVHPGTAEHVLDVVEGLKANQRGRIWDWAGNEVVW